MENQNLENLPDFYRKEAKRKAMAVLELGKNCMSYVLPEDLETSLLFVPVVSIIRPTKEDFYDPIPQVGIMAKPPLMNLIKEKAGVEIIRTDTAKRGEFIWIAHAWGEKRQPDGSMITQDASYEFDAEKRSELDCINQPQKYNTDVLKRKHLLETAKFGEQRAVTGAQHALICKLAKCARSFKTPEELMRGMTVVRIDRNTDGILSDPQMREAALRNAMGARDELFGPRNATPKPDAIEAPADEEKPSDDFADDEIQMTPEQAEYAELRATLQDFLTRGVFDGASRGKAMVQTALDDPAATPTTLREYIERGRERLAKKAVAS
jgi:hypothetical protein